MTEDRHTDLTREEFVRRFKAHLNSLAGTPPPDEQEGADRYAQQAAEAAWDEPEKRAEGPEECASADYSYWED